MKKFIPAPALVAVLFSTAGGALAQGTKAPDNKPVTSKIVAPAADLSGTWELHVRGLINGAIVMDDMQFELKLAQSGAAINGTATGDLPVIGWIHGSKVTLKQKMATSAGSAIYIVYTGSVIQGGGLKGTASYPGHKESVTWNATAKELYQQFDAQGAHIDFAMASDSITYEDGKPTSAVGAQVTKFAISGNPIELVTDKVSIDDGHLVFLTKKYGKIRVEQGGSFSVTLWVTPSQSKELLKLVH